MIPLQITFLLITPQTNSLHTKTNFMNFLKNFLVTDISEYLHSFLILVVATTKPMSNRSTNSKSQESRYLVEIQVVYSQENSTGNHNSILPTIYIKSP